MINFCQIRSQIYLTGNFNFAWKMQKTKIQEHRKLRNLIKNKPMFLKMQKISPFSWSKISRTENLFLRVYFFTVFFSFNPSKKDKKIIRTTPFFYWTQHNIIFSFWYVFECLAISRKAKKNLQSQKIRKTHILVVSGVIAYVRL